MIDDDDQHRKWIKNGSFDKGIAIIMGKIRRGKYKDKYLACIDLDNKKGIDEFLYHFGKVNTLENLAEKTIVEQHLDDKFKAHVYFIVEKSLSKRSGISGLGNKQNIPSIEVKSESSHGIMFCTPSIHKNGHPYQIIGTLQPTVLNSEQSIALENSINQIYTKYANVRTRSQEFLPSIIEMDKEDYKVWKGNNRHLNVLRKCDSWFKKSNETLTFEELFNRAIIWNKKHCDPPLGEKDVSSIVKQSIDWIIEKNLNLKTLNSDKIKNDNAEHDGREIYDIFHKNELLDKIPDKKIIEYVTKVAQKTVKQENILVRLILYTGLSAYTKDPLNLGVMAPTSEGKTYAVNEVIKFLPKQDVWLIGSMSPKVMVRDRGVWVDENYIPIASKIFELKDKIKKEKDEIKIGELEEQLDSLYKNSKMLIDLTNKVLVFLEPPHIDTWNILKSILSHDSMYIEHPYVYQSKVNGQEVKHIVTKGWPACIFCSAKDQSNWSMWPEIQSRFFITSPNMIKQKYQDSNELIAQKKGLPFIVQQQVIVSEEQIQLAKNLIVLLKEELIKNFDSNVWIPFRQYLSQSLPSEKGTDVRITNRLFSLLTLITKSNSYIRPKLIMGDETLSISTPIDLEEVLTLTQDLTGIPPHKLEFFINIFARLFNSKTVPDRKIGDDRDIIKEEDRIALTTSELADFFKKVRGHPITIDNMTKTYLHELKNNGIIDEMDSKLDGRKKIYYPLIDTLQFQSQGKELKKINNYTNIIGEDNNLQFAQLKLSNNYNSIPKNWLNLEILDLIKYGIGKTNIFDLLDKDNNKTCICQFVKEYNKFGSLIQYFQYDENCIYSSKIFGQIIKI